MNEKFGFQRYPMEQSQLWVTCPKRVRVFFGGEAIADSQRVMLLRTMPPTYYFPREDVRMDLLKSTEHTERGKFGEASYWTVEVGERRAENAAWHFVDPPSSAPDVKGYVAFDWKRMDAWYEEDEPVTVHPRDPYTRLDILQSSRPVKVVIAGETVAESERPVLLFETGLPTRYYLYRTDVRMDLLEPTDKHTECPYKGVASYYSVRVGETLKENIVWTYPFPNPQHTRIQNLLCFYSEKLDGFYVDGQPLPDVEMPGS